MNTVLVCDAETARRYWI